MTGYHTISIRELYEKIIASYQADGDYLILTAYDRYDVPSYSKNDENLDDFTEMFRYYVCSVCPIKITKAALGFSTADNTLRNIGSETSIAAPEIGFMFPCFDDRKTNIYNAVFYTRSTKESYPDVVEALRALGRRTVKAFDVGRRFVHLEFFRLTKEHKGLGEEGDYVALEVNMRPPGGYTPDMMDYAHSTDVYKIYADMVCYDERRLPVSEDQYYCVYASRKDGNRYSHTHEEIMERYGVNMVMQEEMPEISWATMGRYMYTVKLKTLEETLAFINFVQG